MQARATIPAHLRSAFFEVGKRLGTDDPTIINTHILSCYFTGDRSAPATLPQLPNAIPEGEDPYSDIVEWDE